jgi:hypothetical protein
LRERLLELAGEKPRYGYRRLHVLLRRDRAEHINQTRSVVKVRLAQRNKKP